MIIEYFGISGVGKSTIMTKFIESNNNSNIVCPSFYLYEQNSWLIRNIKKFIIISFFILKNPRWCVFFYKNIKTHKMVNAKNLYVILFNGFFLKRQLLRCIDSSKIYLFDEGVFQLIWAIYLRSDETPDEILVSELLDLFEFPNKVVVVNAKDDVIYKRLQNRCNTGRNTEIYKSGDVLKNIKRMKKNQQKILKIAKRFFVTKKCIVEIVENNEVLIIEK